MQIAIHHAFQGEPTFFLGFSVMNYHCDHCPEMHTTITVGFLLISISFAW